MKMIKKISVLLAALLLVSMLAACGQSATPATEPTTEATTEAVTEAAAETTAAELATGTYTLYNVTGEKLTELYLYETGADKGENRVPDGMNNSKKLVLTYEAAADTTLTLEYITESGASAKFETLRVEEVPIAMQIVDAASGATPISFSIPQDTGNYKLVNTTGTTVTALYVYLNGGEKGENLAGTGLEDGASVDFSITADVDASLTVEFTTEKDGTKTFETLHIENVTINLLSADGMSGATPIQFGY